MENVLYGKAMDNLRNRIRVILANNENDYLKWTSKRSYISPKIFDNYLVVIAKNRNTLAHPVKCAY